MKIGMFEIPERVIFPKSHKELQGQLRALAKSMDLNLRFVERKRFTESYCDPLYARAIVVSKFKGRRFPRVETAHYALHEIAHWMDYNNGLFQDYYARWGYKYAIYPTEENVSRLGVRAEQHCDRLAHMMLWVMYGRVFSTEGVYDNSARARQELLKHYDIEC